MNYLNKFKFQKNQKCAKRNFSLSFLNMKFVRLALILRTTRAARESNPLFYPQQQD